MTVTSVPESMPTDSNISYFRAAALFQTSFELFRTFYGIFRRGDTLIHLELLPNPDSPGLG